MSNKPAAKKPTPVLASDEAAAATALAAEKHAAVLRRLENLFSSSQGVLVSLTSKFAPIVAVDPKGDATAFVNVRGALCAVTNMNPNALANAMAILEAVAIVMVSLRQDAKVVDVLDCTVEPSLSQSIRDSKMAETRAWMAVREACVASVRAGY